MMPSFSFRVGLRSRHADVIITVAKDRTCKSNISTMLTATTLLLLMAKPARPFCSLRQYHNTRTYDVRATSRNITMMSDGDNISSSTTITSSSQKQNHNVFQGQSTKMGKRLRKREDKATNNARVRNSYLKLSLDQSAFHSLHELICTTKQQWDSSVERQDLKTVSKKQSKRQLTIKPRTLPSLHMTYFFCGKVLDEMPYDEVSLWNSMVQERLLEYNDATSSVGEYTLKFKGLKLFPPNKHYLVVAMFEPSSKLYGLYEELCNLAMSEKPTHLNDGNAVDESKYLFPLLAELTKSQHDKRNQNKNSSPLWVAHVTLGNLSGGSRDDVKRLNSWLEDYKYQESAMLQLSNEIKVNGLALGGPLPSHVDVDWEYPFHPAA